MDARGRTVRAGALVVRLADRVVTGAANRPHRPCGPGRIGSYVDGSSFRNEFRAGFLWIASGYCSPDLLFERQQRKPENLLCCIDIADVVARSEHLQLIASERKAG